MFPLLARLIETGTSQPRSWLSQFAGEVSVILLVCVSVVSPNLQFSQQLPMVRLDLLLLVLVTGGFAWLLLAGKVGKLELSRFILIGALFSVSVTVSLIHGAAILHNSIQPNDFYEISKAWVPVAFFVVGYEAKLSERGITSLMNWLAFVTVVICFCGWSQLLNFPLAGELQAIYGDGGHNDRALLVFHRIYATLTNPNVLGEFLSWTLVGYTLAFLYRVGNQARNLFVALLCMVTLTQTGSRYGILAACLGFLIALALARKAVRGLGKTLALLLLLAAFGTAFIGVQRASYFTSQRFEELRNPAQVSSLRDRLDDLWIVASDYFLRSPVLGQGPAKRIFDEAYTDSEYLDILKKFGLAGFAVYLGFYLWPLAQIRRALKWNYRIFPSLDYCLPGNLFSLRFGFLMLCMALFMNAGMYTCFNWYLMCFLWVWTGVSVRSGTVVCEAITILRIAGVMSPRVRSVLPRAAYPEAGVTGGMEYA